ncbi:MAG: RrF2 family transcriptional regulator [Candidatus Krumholzibacteriia bacterium]
MIVSRSADYALRAMVYLAQLETPRFVPANEIANEMHTPPFLLSRILQHLVKGGLLVSMKGHHGGFRLRKNADTITALEIINLIDGPFVVFDCSGHTECGLSDDCTLLHVFSEAEKLLGRVFKAVSLTDLARRNSRNPDLLMRAASTADRVGR